jgi:hypothetical protein
MPRLKSTPGQSNKLVSGVFNLLMDLIGILGCCVIFWC